MVYVKNNLNHMFPCDGSLIKTEKIELKTGNWVFILSLPNRLDDLLIFYLASKTFITTSVIKNGNVFSLHLVDPKKEKPDALKNDDEFRDTHAIHGTIKSAKDAIALAEEHKNGRLWIWIFILLADDLKIYI